FASPPFGEFALVGVARHATFRRMTSPLTTPARVLYAVQICQRTKCEASGANPRPGCDLAHTSRLCRSPTTAAPVRVSVRRRLTESGALARAGCPPAKDSREIPPQASTADGESRMRPEGGSRPHPLRPAVFII